MKRLVLCCDGTWNTPDQRVGEVECPTNVVKVSRAVRLKSDDGVHQIVHYQRGVGARPGLDRWTGGAFGHGLETNVQDAYHFVVNNYNEGDEIFLFGFSRGAFTARSIVGFIRNSGLLHREERHRFPEAYELYRRDDVHPDDPEARTFRKMYARDVRVKFLGVWDTVGALGIPIRSLNWLTRRKYQFHDVQLSRIVDNAYHAVAIDERRRQFKPTLWEAAFDEKRKVEQVWFAGVHSNVGGGYEDSGLADIALEWMLNRATEHGLSIDEQYAKLRVKPDPLGELRDSFKGMYRFSKPLARRIPSDEDIHPAACERMQRVHYRPENLVDYLSRRPDACP
jgi:uncharacterized protein (DUF2235 family)